MYFSGQEAIYIEGTAHCANMYPEREDDPQQLKQARYINTVESIAHCASMFPQREDDLQQLQQARYIYTC